MLLCLAAASTLCEADGNTLIPDGPMAPPDHHGAGGRVDVTAALGYRIQGSRRMPANPKKPVPLAAMPSARPRMQDLDCLQSTVFLLILVHFIWEQSPTPTPFPKQA